MDVTNVTFVIEIFKKVNFNGNDRQHFLIKFCDISDQNFQKRNFLINYVNR